MNSSSSTHLECFLDRLVHSKFADTFILKGGVLLAALDARRPTRDIDFAVRAIENTTENVLSAVQTIAAISLEDGMESMVLGRTPKSPFSGTQARWPQITMLPNFCGKNLTTTRISILRLGRLSDLSHVYESYERMAAPPDFSYY